MSPDTQIHTHSLKWYKMTLLPNNDIIDSVYLLFFNLLAVGKNTKLISQLELKIHRHIIINKACVFKKVFQNNSVTSHNLSALGHFSALS